MMYAIIALMAWLESILMPDTNNLSWALMLGITVIYWILFMEDKTGKEPAR